MYTFPPSLFKKIKTTRPANYVCRRCHYIIYIIIYVYILYIHSSHYTNAPSCSHPHTRLCPLPIDDDDDIVARERKNTYTHTMDPAAAHDNNNYCHYTCHRFATVVEYSYSRA